MLILSNLNHSFIVGSGQKLNFKYAGGQVVIDLPAGVRSNLVDVIEVELKK